MPKNDAYDALTLSQDASAFAKSRFGQHYIRRITRLREGHLEVAQNVEFNDSYRANHASKASALGDELEFFRIAQTIQQDKTLLEKLREKFMKGGEAKKRV